jgi:hypothetical protein
VVTTSHGMTGPLNDPVRMAGQLGLLVDDLRQLLRPEPLLEKWMPDGAIWYAHACCSAGGGDRTRFDGLVAEGSSAQEVLRAVAGLGARTAPLPRALLGAERPLRAFVGHVEPTFDWTLRHPLNRQVLTDSIRAALYDGLYRAVPEPVGMAFEDWFREVGGLLSQWDAALRELSQATTPAARSAARARALRFQLTGLDRQSAVILGDPTVCIPA